MLVTDELPSLVVNLPAREQTVKSGVTQRLAFARFRLHRLLRVLEFARVVCVLSHLHSFWQNSFSGVCEEFLVRRMDAAIRYMHFPGDRRQIEAEADGNRTHQAPFRTLHQF
ncbi:MAG: hypothetical protein CMM01_05315 [Rhodopirellula sp.]|nr:hypothetical protein [Rhodopirellula sp.]